jgi:hypothetical protein
MSGLDRRLLRNITAARRFVALVAAIGLASALLLIAQAGLLAEVISAAFLGGDAVSGGERQRIALPGRCLRTGPRRCSTSPPHTWTPPPPRG